MDKFETPPCTLVWFSALHSMNPRSLKQIGPVNLRHLPNRDSYYIQKAKKAKKCSYDSSRLFWPPLFQAWKNLLQMRNMTIPKKMQWLMKNFTCKKCERRSIEYSHSMKWTLTNKTTWKSHKNLISMKFLSATQPTAHLCAQKRKNLKKRSMSDAHLKFTQS